MQGQTWCEWPTKQEDSALEALRFDGARNLEILPDQGCRIHPAGPVEVESVRLKKRVNPCACGPRNIPSPASITGTPINLYRPA